MASTSQNLEDLRVDVGVIKAQMSEVKKQNDRIVNRLDSFAYVTVSDANDRYVSKEEFLALKSRIEPVLKGLAVTGAAAAVTLVGLLINFVARGGLQ